MIVHNVNILLLSNNVVLNFFQICAMFKYIGYCSVNINDTVRKNVRLSLCVTHILEGQNILYVFRCNIILVIMFLIKRADKKV